ncbi:hypothetical protein, partial [uncultured Dialister sp.]|uniref:hypothetical protein n=1 Tax=uncultured Dialister sp. TaxID=278064 RepID=UPI0026DD4A8C
RISSMPHGAGETESRNLLLKGFPICLDALVFLTGRKLFAKGFLFGLNLCCFLPTGNYLQRVSYPA